MFSRHIYIYVPSTDLYICSLGGHTYEKTLVMNIAFYERIYDEYILVLINTHISSVCVCERERYRESESESESESEFDRSEERVCVCVCVSV